MTQAEFQRGERVQVMNPAPMDAGTVAEDSSGPLVRVRWDDGQESWSRFDLLDRPVRPITPSPGKGPW